MKPDAELLVGQFILCASEEHLPEGWPVRRHAGWSLAAHGALPVVNIRDGADRLVGWLLGYAVSPAGHLLTEEVRFDVSSDSRNATDRFESILYDHGGRFAAVCFVGRKPRFYLDPTGSLATVFCERQHILASTPTLVPYAEGCGDREELIRVMDIPRKDNWYPFGLTPRYSVERLIPNHYLDLSSWKAVRHWPSGEIETEEDTEKAVLEITQKLKANILGVCEHYPLHMSLTAGQDSRMLLACAREILEQVVFFTFATPYAQGRLDCRMARRLAKRLSLDHRVIPFEKPTETDRREWLHRTGGCVSGSWQYVRCYGCLDADRAILLGTAGELGRAYHWRRGETPSTPVSASDLFQQLDRYLTIPKIAEIEARAGQWLDELPTRNSLRIWDLLYLEQRDGCWAGPFFYGLQGGAFFMSPYSHRGVLERMLRLPPAYRRDNMLSQDVIRGQWPALLQFSFNWPMGLRKYIHGLTWRAKWIYKRLAGKSR